MLKLCYKTYFLGTISCKFPKSLYLCIVFFIVLDLRLTRLEYSGTPFFVLIYKILKIKPNFKQKARKVVLNYNRTTFLT